MASGSLKESVLDDSKEVMIVDELVICDEVPHRNQNLFEGEDGTPRVGLVFNTCEDVRKFYSLYAQRVGFGINKRSSTNREDGTCEAFKLACDKEGQPRNRGKNPYCSRPSAKTNCKAKIIARLHKDGLYHLNHVHLDHNHVVSPSKSRFYKSNRKLPNHVMKHLEFNDDAGVRLNKSVQIWAKRMGGFDKLGFTERDCRNYVDKIRRLKLGEGDAEAIHKYFVHMQSKYPKFFYAIDIDFEGRLRNIFWADSRSRSAYQYFGDVISFDTTYLTNKYDMPFAPFVGVNHHGQSILLGCQLLANESIKTYTWLFVFPEAHHRLCLWHIMKKISQKLGSLNDYKCIKKQLKSIVYQSLRIEEFEKNWLKLVEVYKLEENEWLRSLYEIRSNWIPVFVKDIFWAGMSTTQRSESMNAFFDGYIHSKTSLKQFVEKYEFALQSKYEKDAQADFYSFNMTPPLISKYHMEKQISEIYTFEMFKKFQEEIKALLYCHVSFVKKEEFASTFKVLEHVMEKDGKSLEDIKYEVSYDENNQKVWCICRSFEFRGILCRHALSVLIFLQVFEIPSHYILARWRKDFKRLHALASTTWVVDNQMEQYENIHMHCLELADIALTSSDRYDIALKLINEVKEKLLEENITCTSSQAIHNLATTLGGLGDVAVRLKLENDQIEENENISMKILNPNPVRRKGRPPSKRKQSIMEKIYTTQKKKVSQKKIKTGNENNVDRHDTPTGTQVIIDLTVDTSSTNLPERVVANEEFPRVVANEEFSRVVANEEFPRVVANEEFPRVVANEEYRRVVANEEYRRVVANEDKD